VSVGTVSCLQPGSGNVTAQFQAIIYTLNCFQQHPTPTVGGPVAVTPHITSISPAVGTPGSAASITVNGSGFGPDSFMMASGNGISIVITLATLTEIVHANQITVNGNTAGFPQGTIIRP
jgi:hypothetical protein